MKSKRKPPRDWHHKGGKLKLNTKSISRKKGSVKTDDLIYRALGPFYAQMEKRQLEPVEALPNTKRDDLIDERAELLERVQEIDNQLAEMGYVL